MASDDLALIRTLVDQDVDFIIIGGVAGQLLGSPIVTFDLDVCHARDRPNLERLARALTGIGARLRGAPADLPFRLDAQTLWNGDSFTFDTAHGPLDILGTPSGTSGYDDLASGAVSVKLDGRQVRFASLDDLIRMKRAAWPTQGPARDRGAWRPARGTGPRWEPLMRSGIVVNAGSARELTDLAKRAEDAGWDGVFTYDCIAIGDGEMYDPWAILAAMAMTTTHVRLGAIVFAPTRRRAWKVAREAVTIDHLSNGRLVLPVGLGALEDRGFGNVGEVTGLRERAAILDEHLAILDGLWSGEPFGFLGAHLRFEPMTFLPRPIQTPRIPIWVVGVATGERSLARALRWDGVVLQTADPVEIAGIVDRVRQARPGLGSTDPFEIVAQGSTPVDPVAASAIVQPVADAGATWWIEADWSAVTLGSLRARIDAGPPRVS